MDVPSSIALYIHVLSSIDAVGGRGGMLFFAYSVLPIDGSLDISFLLSLDPV